MCAQGAATRRHGGRHACTEPVGHAATAERRGSFLQPGAADCCSTAVSADNDAIRFLPVR